MIIYGIKHLLKYISRLGNIHHGKFKCPER